MLYPFAAALREEGVDADVLLASSELRPEVYFDADARVEIAQAGRFVRAAEARSSHPALGLVAARHCDLAQLHALEYLASSSRDVASAVAGVLRHQALLADWPVLSVETHGDELVLRYDLGPCKIRRSVQEFVVGALVWGGYRAITGVEWPRHSREVETGWAWFTYPEPPRASAAYREFFGDRVRFEAPVTGVASSIAASGRPSLRANAYLKQMLERELSVMARRIAAKASLAERARLELSQALGDHELGLGWLARRLHMSRTSVKRRLASEGTSFSALLQDIRRQEAMRYLREREMSLDEVAFHLGFQSVSALHKACKRWTGLTPGELRADAKEHLRGRQVGAF